MNSVQEPDELVDVVDENDCVINTVWRSIAVEQSISYRRIVCVFLIDPQERFCLLRRAATKVWAPNNLSLVGGAVQSGESYEQAFKREVAEEIMMNVDEYTYQSLGILSPKQSQSLHFKGVFEIRVHQPSMNIMCNPVDFSEYYWITKKEFFEKVHNKDQVTSDLVPLINHFYGV